MKLVVKILVKEDKTDELTGLCKELVAETRKESGCLCYELCRDIKNKNLLVFIEEWESAEALEKHKGLPHYRKMIPFFKEYIETGYPVEKYDRLI
ncbi:MAG: putative quinol monooxygenase [Christensenellales bacterium]